jgi:hypothetical protein
VRNKYIWIVLSIAVAMVAVVVVVFAGNPDGAPGPPESTYSYTLEDIYQRLDTGAESTPITFTEPISGPGTGTMHTLDDIMGVAPTVDDTNGATRADVLAGMTVWGLTAGEWGLITGTMPDNGAVTMVPTTMNQDIAMGYHDGLGYVEGDADLVAGNIISGVNIFGVSGTYPLAPAAKTGQTKCYDASGTEISCTDTGQDGEYQMGVSWPSPRFADNGDGTVTDNLTKLVWLKNANCFSARTWTQALSDANGLAHGSCGLTDGSSAGDWRLPNVRELQSLIDYSQYNRALPSGHPFTDVQFFDYWTSSTVANDKSYAWTVPLDDGYVSYDLKTNTDYVWPVRGGQ